MMSLFSEEMTHSDIIYYINEKENAIAPKVTDKGASAVQQQIDEIFVKTAAQVGLDLLDTISEVTSSDGAQAAAQNLTENIRKIGADLDSTCLLYTSFERNYKKRIRRGFAAILIIPLIFLILMFSISSKMVFLVLWITSIIVIALYLICVEYLHESLKRRLKVSRMSQEELLETRCV